MSYPVPGRGESREILIPEQRLERQMLMIGLQLERGYVTRNAKETYKKDYITSSGNNFDTIIRVCPKEPWMTGMTLEGRRQNADTRSSMIVQYDISIDSGPRRVNLSRRIYGFGEVESSIITVVEGDNSYSFTLAGSAPGYESGLNREAAINLANHCISEASNLFEGIPRR
jgi:hypothetical protein